MLFRPEASRGRHRLHGEVSLAPPVSWQVLGFFLGGVLAVALLFLSLATYGVKVTAIGQIEGDKGVARITPARAGTLSTIFVKEGDLVRAGQLLARLEIATVAGAGSLEARRLAAIAEEAHALGERSPAVHNASRARVAALQADQSGHSAELSELAAQMTEQATLIASAQADLDQARAIAVDGFVSGNDLRLREQALAERRQGMMRMRGDRARLVAQVARDTAEIGRAKADLEVARADAARAGGELAGTAAGDSVQRWIQITAPIDGRVTGVVRTLGERIAPDRPLLSLVPTGTRLVAKLAVPAAGVGFVRPGQRVAIALDAFPREIFGTQPARVAFVTAASVPGTAPHEPSFLAEATLDRPLVVAYGARYPLRPGMTLSATITTRRLSLLRWLLDPLFAVTAS
ncbi:HlyD family secretion protein [Sphingomonas sp. PAMC 26617]|uniref:HlyD family secretion protein n=1 Tax=Sphingomonas sp. PAMC 26617 TaxID=1112216 RepID=UPI001E47C9CE|nr:HlyD family efflux transporter periplasmic adaptor subunit [Sphingomonas sp. PAMC 26617]